jgi:Domain of unknown function (DUF4407)
MSLLDRLERLFIWLSGASAETLASCPAWERRKYVAFGATVLVPSSFALIASAYAISTLTDQWQFIIPVATVWACIILTVDRALLAIYRAYQNIFRKLAQFVLRIVVAALMGMTISHPMTLLLFRDTIQTVVEKDRQKEVDAERTKSEASRKVIEDKIPAVEKEIAAARDRWNETFNAKFLENERAGSNVPLTDEQKQAKLALEAQVTDATKPLKDQLATLEKQISEQEAANAKIATELGFWQTEFEREINGERSGMAGEGPRAKSIREDQLAWRRAESTRLASLLASLTLQKKEQQTAIDATAQLTTERFNSKLAENAAKTKLESERLATLKQQVQQQQADQFVVQQNGIRDTLQKQLDAQLAQLKGLHEDINRLGRDEESRITKIQAEPRRDILTQTLALHGLFDAGSQGGNFAFGAYLVLTMLFMLVDTIPLVVKFFSKPGPYDSLIDLDEVRFDRERKTFLTSFNRYMEGLSSGTMLHLTRNKPLEAALIEGVDRSRVGKEFLEHLLELERSFEEKIHAERAKLVDEKSSERINAKIAMLEDMMQAFYADLRSRMDQFFNADQVKRIASTKL